MNRLGHETRLMYQPLPIAGVVAVWGLLGLAFSHLLVNGAPGARVGGVVGMLEAGLPILALVAVCHAASLEWEEGSIELSLTYPGGGVGLLVARLLVGIGFFGAVVAATLGGFTLLMPELLDPGPLNVFRVAWLVTPPALFVGTVGLLMSIAGRHYVAGIAGGLLIWGLDLLLPGKVTGQLYLFQASQPLPAISLDANRWWLTAAAAVVAGLAVALWSRRERAVR